MLLTSHLKYDGGHVIAATLMSPITVTSCLLHPGCSDCFREVAKMFWWNKRTQAYPGVTASFHWVTELIINKLLATISYTTIDIIYSRTCWRQVIHFGSPCPSLCPSSQVCAMYFTMLWICKWKIAMARATCLAMTVIVRPYYHYLCTMSHLEWGPTHTYHCAVSCISEYGCSC